jgi:hypothetical protein
MDGPCRTWWLTSVILATQEEEIREDRGSSKKLGRKTPSVVATSVILATQEAHVRGLQSKAVWGRNKRKIT